MFRFVSTSAIELLLPGIRAMISRSGCKFYRDKFSIYCQHEDKIITLDKDKILKYFHNEKFAEINNYINNVIKGLKQQ